RKSALSEKESRSRPSYFFLAESRLPMAESHLHSLFTPYKEPLLTLSIFPILGPSFQTIWARGVGSGRASWWFSSGCYSGLFGRFRRLSALKVVSESHLSR